MARIEPACPNAILYIDLDLPQPIRNHYNEIVVTSTELRNLDRVTRAHFQQNSSSVITLITQAGISVNQLKEMSQTVRAEFFQHADIIKNLHIYGNICAQQLVTMESTLRTQLIIHSHSFIGLKITKNFSVEKLIQLNAEQAQILLSSPNSPESSSIFANLESSSNKLFEFCSIS